MSKVKIYNHIAPGFSEMEWNMVKHIPQGGNWKNIPIDNPSKRIAKIRETGGRTTLYGRMEWDMPSYTISTYFSRMGNGTFIHPKEDRLISLREGARLQSFQDFYEFKGTKTSMYKQIGNAVPVLLARFIATLVKNDISSKKIIDLFCGAGGMSSGFSMEGFTPILAVEKEKHFIATFKHNHPLCKCINDDITLDSTKNDIVNSVKGENIGLIIGGPPCQGFSLAGHRDENDDRNQLYKDYLDVVSLIQPEGFVIENVPGILSMSGGKVNLDILKSIKKMGYHCDNAIKLNAHDFGVPQRRTRVFYIATKKQIGKLDVTPLFGPNSEQKKPYLTVRNAIYNLPKIKALGGSDVIDYDFKKKSMYDKLMLGEITFNEFYELYN